VSIAIPTLQLQTARLELVLATAELARADASDRVRLAELLQAEVPASWPPELMLDHVEEFAQKLERDPQHGIRHFYWIRTAPARVLIGSGGLFDLGDRRWMLGYAVLDEFQRRGLATEAAAALVAWALAPGQADTIVADTYEHLRPSIRVLEECGFVRTGGGAEPGTIRFERSRTPGPAA
jgi:RimJ/RimL family protein N-acetyltransferase